MKNSKKGFTLIELLVTIILILSVLAVAIVSYISISNNKKEQAYNSVKEEIIGAAKDYFYTKEYLFEGLEDGSSGIITVGKLVEEDYLNKVTDPRDGKTINTCSRVVVTKENGKYKTEYKEYKEGFSCDSDNSIILTEPGAPSLDVKVKTGEKGKNNWYKSSVVVLAEAKTDGNGAIAKTGICNSDICNSYKDYNQGNLYEDSQTYVNDTKGITTWYMTENIFGKKTFKGISLRIDKTAPEVSVLMENSSWTNADKVKYTYEASDNFGLDSLVGYWNKYGLTKEQSDATNCWWNGTSYGQGNCLGGNSSNEATNGILAVNGSDYFYAEGYRKITYKACDEAGNCTDSNEAIAKIDKTAPKVSVVIDNSDWTNADKVYYTYEASDNLGLSSLVGYWNKAGLTETQSNSNNCVWNGTSYGSATCLGSNGANQTTQGATSINKRSNFSAEGHRKIRFIACDLAGNCKTSDAAVARIDRTAPTMELVESTGVSNGEAEYKHTLNIYDNIGGLKIESDKSVYYYNHCYDWYITTTADRFCKDNTASDGKNIKKLQYPVYANRYPSDKDIESGLGYTQIQEYKETNGLKTYEKDHHCDSKTKKCYYHLFYKLTDKANNTSYYRYKLWYGSNGQNYTLTKVQ